MRLLRCTALVLCLTCSACQHYSEPRFCKGALISPGVRQILYSDSTGRLNRTTYHTNGLVERTVWQVVLQDHKGSTPTPLFTVERILDEKIPGAPYVVHPEGQTVLRDQAGTYVYSFRQRSFIHNLHPEAVYIGSYRDEL